MRFLREQFFNLGMECTWLRTVALKHVVPPAFGSFTLYGNEDSPTRIDLYASNDPLYNDQPVAVYEMNLDSGNLELKK